MASSTKIMSKAIANPRYSAPRDSSCSCCSPPKRVCQVRVHGGQVRENRIDQDVCWLRHRKSPWGPRPP